MPSSAGPTQGAERHEKEVRRWEGRPKLARAFRFGIIAGPLVLSLLFTLAMGRWLPPDVVGLNRWVWIVFVFVLANILLHLMVRAARVFTPLAGLMALSLVFPDQAPSRSKAALRRSSSAKMLRSLQAATLADEADSVSALRSEYLVQLLKDINKHDRLTRGHSERVRAYAELLGEELGVKGEELDKLRWGALLHDVGKLEVPADILNKDGRPSDDEWEILKTHPSKSATYLEPLEGWLGDWALAAEEHHARYDGNGYPEGLAGTDISIAGRIVAVADAYDVMTSARSYKAPLSAEVARQELTACAGAQFDPRVVNAFLRVGLGDLRTIAGPLAWLANLTGSLQLPVPLATGAVTSVGAATSAAATIAAAAALVVSPVMAEPTGPLAFDEPVVETVADVVAVDDIFRIDEDTSVVLAVLSNDVTGEDGAARVVEVTAAQNGQVEVEAGQVRYTPPPDFNGEDQFTYVLANGEGQRVEATVTITVVAIQDAPVVESASGEVSEDAALGTAITQVPISDPDGDPLTVSLVPSDAASLFRIDDRGHISLAQPIQPGFRDRYEVRVEVSDGIDVTRTTVSISVLDTPETTTTVAPTTTVAQTTVPPTTTTPTAPNSAPFVFPLRVETMEDTPVGTVLGTVVLGDVDGDPLTTSITSGDPAGLFAVSDDGTFGLAGPVDHETQALYELEITVSDGITNTVQVITVEVVNVDEAPIVEADFEAIPEDGSILLDVLANDFDPEAETLTVVAVSNPANGTATLEAGGVRYTPDPDYYGTDPFEYTVSDGTNSVSVAARVQVFPFNDAPTVVGETLTVFEDEVGVVDIVGNDEDVDGDTLTWIVDATSGAGGTLSENNGIVTYTPPPDFFGVDRFSYIVTDEITTPVSATVNIMVNAVQDPPTIEATSGAIAENAPVGAFVTSISVADADDDTVTLDITDGDPLDQFAIANDGTLVLAAPVDRETQSSYRLTIEASDGIDTVETFVDIEVTEINEPPVASDDTVGGFEDSETEIDLSDLVEDPEREALTNGISLVSLPANGSVSEVDGVVTYTPNPDYYGPDSFTYNAQDSVGNTSNTATVMILISPVNDAPVANDDSGPDLTTTEDTTLTFGWSSLLDNDTDVDDARLLQGTILVDFGPANARVGELTYDPVSSSVTYVPAPNYNGDFTFTYTVSDGMLRSAPAEVQIVVTPVNDPPSAVDDALSVEYPESGTTERVARNDTDVDVGDSLTVVSVTDGTFGQTTLNDDGTITYTPVLETLATEDSFTYVVQDESGATATGTVEVTIVQPFELLPTRGQNESTAVGDVDGDGLVDIVVASQTGTTQVFLNQGNGAFAEHPQPDVGNFADHNVLELADVDGDGDLDLIAGHINGRGFLFLNDGNGVFSESDVALRSSEGDARTGDTATDITVGDFNGDNHLDIVFARDRLSDEFVGENIVYLNSGSLDGDGEPIFTTGQVLGGLSRAVAVGDVNNDGILDLFFAGDLVSWIWFGQGDGTFVAPGPFPFAANDVLLASLDSDNRLDMVLALEDFGTIVLINGPGVIATFEPIPEFFGSESADALATGDIDGDGDVDVVISHEKGPAWQVYLNEGDGRLTPTAVAQAADIAGATDLAVADFDGDGTLDIFVTINDAEDIIYLNR